MTFKALARALLPPIVVDLAARHRDPAWSGNFRSWSDALAASSGYDSPVILDRVEAAALKVKRGEAVHERDGVVFETIEYSWPLLSGLLWVAARDGGRLDVVDFGGALGSTYAQNRHFLAPLEALRWSVVEQPRFVERGRRSFQDERLRFYPSLEECMAENTPNVLVLSSVLQYLERPYELLAGLDRFPFTIIDLTPVHDGPDDRLSVQEVPPSIYPARYPCWLFGEARLAAALGRSSRVVAAFDSYIGQNLRVGGLRARYRGYILERVP